MKANRVIEEDFKKMVQEYWKTFLPESPDIEQTRGEILGWFTGNGVRADFKKKFGVNTMVDKTTAKLMLRSLAGFVRLSGYKGLVILFDEADQMFSAMQKQKAALNDAHNNLRAIIDYIRELPGLFLIYATTPDFFSSPNYGIKKNGALAGVIGKLENYNHPPKASDTIWDLDSIEPSLKNYQEAARRILSVYQIAYPDAQENLPSEDYISNKVEEKFKGYSALAEIRFWRYLVKDVIIPDLDAHREGDEV